MRLTLHFFFEDRLAQFQGRDGHCQQSDAFQDGIQPVIQGHDGPGLNALPELQNGIEHEGECTGDEQEANDGVADGENLPEECSDHPWSRCVDDRPITMKRVLAACSVSIYDRISYAFPDIAHALADQ